MSSDNSIYSAARRPSPHSLSWSIAWEITKCKNVLSKYPFAVASVHLQPNEKRSCISIDWKITRIQYFLLTKSFGSDSTLCPRIGDPVIVLKRVHRLQYRRHSPHVRIYLRVAEELCGQVRIKPGLHRSRRIYPQSGIKKDVVQ